MASYEHSPIIHAVRQECVIGLPAAEVVYQFVVRGGVDRRMPLLIRYLILDASQCMKFAIDIDIFGFSIVVLFTVGSVLQALKWSRDLSNAIDISW